MIIDFNELIGNGGGTPTDVKLQANKDFTIQSNGTAELLPDAGYDGLKKATVNVDVPMREEQAKSVEITSNGTTTVSPDTDKVLTGVTITTDVPIPSLQEQKIVEITANGEGTITPDDRKDAMKSVKYTVNVPSSGGGAVINSSLRFSGTYLDEVDWTKFTIDTGMTSFGGDTNSAFYGTRTLNQGSFVWPESMDTSHISNFSYLFQSTYANTQQFNISNIKYDKATSIEGMFSRSQIMMVNLGNTNKTGVGITNAKSVFENCINLNGWYGSLNFPFADNCNYTGMFQNCANFGGTVNPENSIKGGTHKYMFSGCTSMTQITMPNAVITDALGMFLNCTALTDFTVSSWNYNDYIDGEMHSKSTTCGLVYCPNLTVECLNRLIDALVNKRTSRGVIVPTVIYLHPDAYARITSDMQSTASAKGWDLIATDDTWLD